MRARTGSPSSCDRAAYLTGWFTGTSTKAWYLFAGSADAALIVAFLQGKQSPTVEFFGLGADPNKLATTWRVYFDYGSALGDFRAAYRAKGEV